MRGLVLTLGPIVWLWSWDLGMCPRRRKESFGVSESASDDESPLSGLGNAVIGGQEFGVADVEPEKLGYLLNCLVFCGSQQLRDVFHDKDGGVGAAHHLEESAPEFFPGIASSSLVQEAEALAWGAANDDVGLWNRRGTAFQVLDYVLFDAVVSEVESVCGGCVVVEVVCPDRFEIVAEGLRKPACETASASECIDESPPGDEIRKSAS